MKLRVTFTAVPATELALAAGTVKVYQPTRRFAVTRNVEEAAQDWLADYLELTQNIDLTFLQSDELKARKQAALVITPRQPKNIRRAVVTVDLATHLPVHFEVELPLKKQIVAFGRVKTGGPIDPAVFDVTLPAGMTWTAR
jgi:hypothetical protein